MGKWVWLFFWLTSGLVWASQWEDPTWQEMLKGSDVIALVEVVEGGKFIAKVRPLTVFKGEAPAEFYAWGFNNHNWPPEAVEEEALKTGGRYYLFLKPADREYLKDMPRIINDAAFTNAVEKLGSSPVFRVSTPSAGDLPLEGDQVRCSFLRTGYPQFGPKHERAWFESFLRAAIGQADPELLAQTMQWVRAEPAGDEKHESRLADLLASYLLLGGDAYDEAFPRVAASQDAGARLVLAELLGRVSGTQAEELLLKMLSDQDALVQGEVVRQLVARGSEKVGPILLAHLGEARDGSSGPNNIMDPILNRVDGGKLEMIRSLGELKYAPAGPALLDLLSRTTNGYTVRILLDALEKLGRRDYVQALERCLREPEGLRVVADWAGEKHVVELEPILRAALPRSGDNRSRVIEALGKIGNENTAAILRADLRKTISQPPEFQTGWYLEYYLLALGDLSCQAARDEVDRTLFYWIGFDSAFARNPRLLVLKQKRERQIEARAAACFPEFPKLEAHALVWLKNQQVADFAVEVEILSPDHPELTPVVLAKRLKKAFAGLKGRLCVSRRKGVYVYNGGASDVRVDAYPSGLMRGYARYVKTVRDPRDLRLVKYLLQTGLAQRWSSEYYLTEALKETPEGSREP